MGLGAVIAWDVMASCGAVSTSPYPSNGKNRNSMRCIAGRCIVARDERRGAGVIVVASVIKDELLSWNDRGLSLTPTALLMIDFQQFHRCALGKRSWCLIFSLFS